MLFGLFGGLGLFLYGMGVLSDGLQKAAAERLRRLLEILTTNPLMGVLLGTVVTAIIQSSSATTVMVVGFVNAGLMNLRQAAGVIMGANIGTTMTAQIIAFNATQLALPAVAIGFLLTLITKSKRVHYIGQSFVGFGLLFLGMSIMSSSMKPLAEMQWFVNLTATLSKNRILGILTGAVMTGLIQSSSATIGILQSLAREGVISLHFALPVLFGDNIGTTVTALLSSLGASLAAKRAALIHLIFNVLGTIIFTLILPVVVPVVQSIGGDTVRQIANAHTLFNVTNTLIQLPFIGVLVFLVTKILPGIIETPGPKYLDERFLETPVFALEQVNKELTRMGKKAQETVENAMLGLINSDEECAAKAFRLEQEINDLDKQITNYLVALSKQSLTEHESEAINMMINVANDIERMGDHGENLAELALEKINGGVTFSAQAAAELSLMRDRVLHLAGESIAAFRDDNKKMASQLYKLEEEVDRLEEELRTNHIMRLNTGDCDPTAGIIFLDAISNLERVADHAGNIGNWVSSPTSVFSPTQKSKE